MHRGIVPLRAMAAVLTLAVAAPAAAEVGPERVLVDFLHASYSRDADAAYRLLSRADRVEKSFADYVAESGQLEGPALQLARSLADEIRTRDLRVERDGERAIVRFGAAIPDANAAEIEHLVLGFAPDRLAALGAGEIAARRARLRQLAAEGRLPMLHAAEETWTLVREDDGWRVFLNWAEAVEVSFEAVVFHDLGWRFVPERRRVMARHGETLQMVYRARNIGRRETTGKARHIVGPAADSGFLEIVSCFCFLEQTLAPGEAVELPLVFRVDFEAPEGITGFQVRYELYPADRFPDGHPQVGAAG